VLADEAFVRGLWETVTSRGIQYRMQITFLRARQSLIQNGIPEAALALTEELKSRLKEEESRSAQQPPGAAASA
jgi:hypothetical protein